MQAEGVARAKDLQVLWKAREKCDGVSENESLGHYDNCILKALGKVETSETGE